VKLVLDEHFPDRMATAIRRECPKVEVSTIHSRELDGLDDAPLLALLDIEPAVLVTRDVTTIRPEIDARLAAGLTHGGIIFVPRSISQADEKTLLRRLVKKLKETHGQDWVCKTEWI
jgi:Domain of unknown function (DUF5615)